MQKAVLAKFRAWGKCHPHTTTIEFLSPFCSKFVTKSRIAPQKDQTIFSKYFFLLVVFSSDICNGFRYNFKGKGDSYKIHPTNRKGYFLPLVWALLLRFLRVLFADFFPSISRLIVELRISTERCFFFVRRKKMRSDAIWTNWDWLQQISSCMRYRCTWDIDT